MGSLYDWSLTAASNGSADATVNFAEGQLAPTLNNSARALMARVAAWVDTIGGAATYGGSSNAYTITSPTGHAITAYASGMIFALKANHTNNAAATVNIDTLGAKSIKTCDGGDPASGDIVSGGIYLLAYDGTNFQLLNTVGGGSYQPLDADLTAIAALGYTSGEYIIRKTAADTWSLITITSAGAAILDDANAAAQLTTLGLTANGSSLVTAANYAAMRALLDLEVGTDFLSPAAIAAAYLALSGGTLTGNLTMNKDNPVLGLIDTTVGGSGLFYTNESDVHKWGRTGVAFDMLLTNDALSVGTIAARAASSTETTGTLTSASANKSIIATGGITLPNAVFTAGDTILIDGGGTARTITRGASVTMYKAGADSATATLAANGLMTVFWRTASVCVLGGDIT